MEPQVYLRRPWTSSSGSQTCQRLKNLFEATFFHSKVGGQTVSHLEVKFVIVHLQRLWEISAKMMGSMCPPVPCCLSGGAHAVAWPPDRRSHQRPLWTGKEKHPAGANRLHLRPHRDFTWAWHWVWTGAGGGGKNKASQSVSHHD